ncbi:MAG: sterol desaturase family protein [Planctomycetaceae bacterium]
MLPESVAAYRLVIFASVLVVMMVVESVWPRRARSETRRARWPGNIMLTVINAVVLRLIEPLSAIAAAILAVEKGWGLLPRLGLADWQLVLVTILLFDLLIYGQHRLSHLLKPAWRLHRVHHADHDLDATTGIRFHPIEIIMSMLIKAGGVLLLGPSPLAVLSFEVLLNASALFNHSNLRLPRQIERPLRWLIVTPEMHEIHHSEVRTESDKNYGFFLSCWDRLFGTYQETPQQGIDGLKIGLDGTRNKPTSTLGFLLGSPIREKP